MVDNYGNENDALFAEFIEEYYMKYLRGNGLGRGNQKDNRVVELYISSDCNMACSYCYITKFKNKIYPENLCSDYDIILKNVSITLDWLISNKVEKIGLNLFSGEFFMLPYWSKLLNIIYEKVKNTNCIQYVGIPSNMSFVLDDNKVTELSNWIKKFMKIKINILLSASIDGSFQESNRQLKKDFIDVYSDSTFYDKVYKFCKEFQFGFHPMVSATGIENWIDNYKFFRKKRFEYDMDEDPMTLEVRDNNWTDEAIEHYLKFLDYMFDTKYEEFNRNNEKMARFIFRHEGFRSGYNNLSLLYQNGRINCTIQEQLFIRVGDMTVVPCHRLSYEQFNYGKFVIENDKIVGVKAGNLSLMAGILSLNTKINTACSKCSIKSFCIKGCLGAQYESNNDPFTVNDSVCRLYKARVEFILNKIIEIGLLEEILQSNDIIPPQTRDELIILVEGLTNNDC